MVPVRVKNDPAMSGYHILPRAKLKMGGGYREWLVGSKKEIRLSESYSTPAVSLFYLRFFLSLSKEIDI